MKKQSDGEKYKLPRPLKVGDSVLIFDIDKNAIQRIECGKRFVTDIEIVCLAGVLGCTVESLLYGKKQLC